ncbi:S100 calcium binding protein U [Brachyhypopomus gauderio]|uniref:S100 calcium binding protein U n=1 Tax=Brachyhypopomus gauderio TaxID=698409 RepID=UPI004040F1E9
METAVKTVVSVFLKSSKGKENLGEKDFQSLVKNQLKNILTDTDSNEAVKNMRQGLDSDMDGKVSFEEYMKLVGYLAMSLSDQRCGGAQVASSVNETSTEVPTVTKVEPQDGKQEEPVKVEVVAKVQEEEVEDEEEKVEVVAETEETS